MSKSGGNQSDYYRQQEQDRQQAVRAGTANINAIFDGDATRPGEFTPSFYDSLRQNYLDYAMPQLEDQKVQADKSLVYSLARGGNLESSTRADQTGRLQKEYDTNAQKVADQALSYENTAKSNVEDARQNLISTLNATGDATGAASSAAARAETLSAPPTYDPLSNLFADWTNTASQNVAAQKAASLAAGAGVPTGGTISSLYSVPSGAVTVRN